MRKTLFTIYAVACLAGRAQVVTTVAGTGATTLSGDGGPATAAGVYAPCGTVKDKNGNLYIAENGSNVVRRVNSSGVITTWAGTGTAGFAGDGGPAALAQLSNLRGIAIDTSGNIYIMDTQNYRIRKVDASGIITTVAGNGVAAYAGDGGFATSASFDWCESIAVGIDQSIYIGDQLNHVVRKVGVNGIISTYAGDGSPFASGDGGLATQAGIGTPTSLSIDKNNTLYLSGDNVIRRVNSNGIITTYAGTGLTGFAGDGGPAVSAKFDWPDKISLDDIGNLYIYDRFNNRVRRVDTFGIINTIAGDGFNGFAGDGGPPLLAEFNNVQGLYCSSNNELFISDFDNHRVRKITGVIGVASLCEKTPFKMGPNPASTELHVESSSMDDAWRILDAMGHEIRAQNKNGIIDVRSFCNGIYFLTITSGNQTHTQKFVVQH